MALINSLRLPLKVKIQLNPSHTVLSHYWPDWNNKSDKIGQSNNVLVFITGNPGVPEYYHEFLTKVYNLMDQKIEILSVGHLGHSKDAWFELDIKKSGRLFGLRDQVDHKIQFLTKLKELYPADTKIMLAGHSVGAWICEQVLKKAPELNIHHLFSLFPTICHIQDTPNGRWLSKVLFPRPFQFLAISIVGLVNYLPPILKRTLTSVLSGQSGPNADVTCDLLLFPEVFRNALHMTDHEMEDIKELDHEFYKDNILNITFYYGTIDDWVPSSHIQIIQKAIPEGNIMICKDLIPHAFPLKHSNIMAQHMINMIQKVL